MNRSQPHTLYLLLGPRRACPDLLVTSALAQSKSFEPDGGLLGLFITRCDPDLGWHHLMIYNGIAIRKRHSSRTRSCSLSCRNCSSSISMGPLPFASSTSPRNFRPQGIGQIQTSWTSSRLRKAPETSARACQALYLDQYAQHYWFHITHDRSAWDGKRHDRAFTVLQDWE